MIMIKPIGPEYADYIAANQSMYPEEMHEDTETFKTLLASSDLSLGILFALQATPNPPEMMLTGWAIIDGSQDPPYLYDLAVLPAFQRKSIARDLMRALLANMRWRGLDLHYHARSTSYPLLASVPFLTECGYQIVSDCYIPNHYGIEYESDTLVEDGHEIFIRPIGK